MDYSFISPWFTGGTILWYPYGNPQPGWDMGKPHPPKPLAPYPYHGGAIGTHDFNVSPAGGVVPIVYGLQKIPGQMIYVKIIQIGGAYTLHVIYLLCEGEIESFEDITVDDRSYLEPYFPYTIEKFYGTQAQAVCGLNLVDADWTYPLLGLAYLYIKFPTISSMTELPSVYAKIKGKKVTYPITSTVAYSTNPAVILYDALINGGVPLAYLNAQSFADVADYCDYNIYAASDVVRVAYGGGWKYFQCKYSHFSTTASNPLYYLSSPGKNKYWTEIVTPNSNTWQTGISYYVAEKRHSFNYSFGEATSFADAIAIMCGHMNARLVEDGSSIRLDYAHEIDPAAATIFTQDDMWDLSINPAQSQDLINRVRFSWTDSNTFEAIEEDIEDPALGSNEVHEASMDCTGCQSYSQAKRLAIFLLNSRLYDLMITFTVYNSKGVQINDLLKTTHPWYGFSEKLFTVSGLEPQENGTVIVNAKEYDTDMFSEDIEVYDNYSDTDLPDPTGIPSDVTGLAVVEDLKLYQDATIMSIALLSWDANTYAYIKKYEIYKATADLVWGTDLLVYMCIAPHVGAAGNRPITGGTWATYWVLVTGDTSLLTVKQWTVGYEYKSIDDFVLDGETIYQSWKISNIIAQQLYKFKVITISSFNVPSVGTVVELTPEGKGIPPVWKTGATLYAQKGESSVIVRWGMTDGSVPVIDRDFAGFVLKKGMDGDTYDTAQLTIYTGNSLQFTDTMVSTRRTSYFLKAYDKAGNYTSTAISVALNVTESPYVGHKTSHTLDIANPYSVKDSEGNPDPTLVLSGLSFCDLLNITYGERNMPFISVAPTTAYDALDERFGTYLDGGLSELYDYLSLPNFDEEVEVITDYIDLGGLHDVARISLVPKYHFADTGSYVSFFIQTSPDHATWTENVGCECGGGQTRYIRARFIFHGGIGSRVTLFELMCNVYYDILKNIGHANTSITGYIELQFQYAIENVKEIKLTPVNVLQPVICVASDIDSEGFILHTYDTNGNAYAVELPAYIDWAVTGYNEVWIPT